MSAERERRAVRNGKVDPASLKSCLERALVGATRPRLLSRPGAPAVANSVSRPLKPGSRRSQAGGRAGASGGSSGRADDRTGAYGLRNGFLDSPPSAPHSSSSGSGRRRGPRRRGAGRRPPRSPAPRARDHLGAAEVDVAPGPAHDLLAGAPRARRASRPACRPRSRAGRPPDARARARPPPAAAARGRAPRRRPARSPSGCGPTPTSRARARRGPSRSTSDGAIMLVSRMPGTSFSEATLRSVSPSMLLRWTPVPGTTTPEPQPVEQVSEAALPSRVEHADLGRPGGSGRPIGTRRVCHLAAPGRRQHPPHGAAAVQRALERGRPLRVRRAQRAPRRGATAGGRERAAQRRAARRARPARGRSARRPRMAAGS